MAQYPIGRCMVYNKYKYFFVHTYKTGTHSITRGFMDEGGDNPVDAPSFPYDLLNNKGYTGIAVVRDPVSRFVSALAMYYDNLGNWIWSQSISQVQRNIMKDLNETSISNLLDKLQEVLPNVFDSHFHPQSLLIGDFPVELVQMENLHDWIKDKFGWSIGKKFAAQNKTLETINGIIKESNFLEDKIKSFYADDYLLRT